MRLFKVALTALLGAFFIAPAQAKFVDIACETTATAGTGTLSLSGSTPSGGYLTLSGAGVTSGDIVPYQIVNGTGSNRKIETGTGTFTDAATDTLTRTVSSSSDGIGTALTLSGTSTVCVGPLAAVLREKLTADKTVYVRTDGSDSHDGAANTAAGAFLTPQGAYDYIASHFDPGGYTVTIRLQNGATYTPTSFGAILETTNSSPFNGTYSGTINLLGDTTLANPPIFDVQAGWGIYPGHGVSVGGVKFIDSVGGGYGIFANTPTGYVTFSAQNEFGSMTGGIHLVAELGGTIQVNTTPYKISGGALLHIYTGIGGRVDIEANTVTLTGTPAFDTFVVSEGDVFYYDNTFVGSATGLRFSSRNRILADTLTSLPGDTAGIIVSGGEFTAQDTNVVTLEPELNALAGLTSAADKFPYFTGSGTAALADLSSSMRTFLTTSSSANLGSLITDDVFLLSDAELGAIAGLTSAADKGIYFTGSGTAATFDLSSSMRTWHTTQSVANLASVLTDEATGWANWQTTPSSANLATYMTDEAFTMSDAELGALAGLTSAADKMPYFTGSGTASTADFSSAQRTFQTTASSANLASWMTDEAFTMSDAELGAIAGLTSAADKGIYFTGSGTAATFDLSSAERTFLTTPSSANLRGVLSDEIGSSVLVFLGTPADDQVPVGDSASATTWRTLADSDGATQKLQYDTTTNAFSAGTDDDVPDAADYSNLTGGTAITNSPTGTINFDATEINTFTLGAGSATGIIFDAGATDPAIETASGSLTIDIGGTNETTLTATAFAPGVNDGNALGETSTPLRWADLFMADGAVIDMGTTSSRATITHVAASDSITIAADPDNATASSAINLQVDGGTEATLNTTNFSPGANDGNALGVSGTAWADLFLASGGLIEFDGGTTNTLTCTSGSCTIEGNGLYRVGGTDVAVADGGTGASTATAGFDALAQVTSTAAGRTTPTIVDHNLDQLIFWDDSAGTAKTLVLADVATEASPAAGDYVLVQRAEDDVVKVNWSSLPGAAGGISNVVEDLTPQLGGDLDANSFDIQFDDNTGIRDDSDNETLLFQKVASAVNYVDLFNAATGTGPIISATGSDAMIPITIKTKGSTDYYPATLGASSAVAMTVDMGDSDFPMLGLRNTPTAPDMLYTGSGGPFIIGAQDAYLSTTTFPFGFEGDTQNSSSALIAFGKFFIIATDKTATSEDGYLAFNPTVAGVVGLGTTAGMYLGAGLYIGDPAGTPTFPGTGNLAFTDDKGIYDDAANEQLLFNKTSTAVNEWQMTNSAANGVQRLEALGGDSNIAITFASKGTDPINLEINGSTEAALTATNFAPGADGGNSLGISGTEWLAAFIDTVSLTTLELGGSAATDATIVRTAAGEATLEGDAIKHAGKQMMWIPAASMRNSATSSASCGDTYDSGSNDLTITVCAFDTGATEERAEFGLGMPKAWDEGTVTFIPISTCAGACAQSETLQYELACASISDSDTMNSAQGTPASSSKTLQATPTNELLVGAESSAITIANTPNENDYVHCRISRDTSVDNMAGDALLVGIKLFWTDNASTLAE